LFALKGSAAAARESDVMRLISKDTGGRCAAPFEGNDVDRAAKRTAAVSFLEDTLAAGRAPVRALESKARAAGLVLDQQTITSAKTFKTAKRQLGIRSIREGFGSSGEWFWVLPSPTLASKRSGHLCEPVPPIKAAYVTDLERTTGSKAVELASQAPQSAPAHVDRDPEVLSWTKNVRQLGCDHPPAGVPLHRWSRFLNDCNVFLNSSNHWADRAALLGWTTQDLFGFSPTHPLLHLGSAGLLWIVNGGQIVEVHRDWALIQTSKDSSQRIVNRRRPATRGIVLPWTRRQHIGGAN
jgi:hypothetical protein